MYKKLFISVCGTSKNKKEMQSTVNSIKKQTMLPDEIIITKGKNISKGRNSYLLKARGDVIMSIDSDCQYEPEYISKMIKCLKKNDIVMSKVIAQPPKKLIQLFCSMRMPQYQYFTEKNWSQFLPSNRQVMFKRSVIKKLGLLPEYLYRSDDTYWFGLARKKGLKFTHCDAIVYWKTKKSLKAYLKTVYQDNRCNKKFKIKGFQAPQKMSPMIFPYGLFVSALAMITKFWAKLR